MFTKITDDNVSIFSRSPTRVGADGPRAGRVHAVSRSRGANFRVLQPPRSLHARARRPTPCPTRCLHVRASQGIPTPGFPDAINSPKRRKASQNRQPLRTPVFAGLLLFARRVVIPQTWGCFCFSKDTSGKVAWIIDEEWKWELSAY